MSASTTKVTDPLPCPRCRSNTTVVRAVSPKAGVWTVYGCDTCFYTWRSTEPEESNKTGQVSGRFSLSPEKLSKLEVAPSIPPLRSMKRKIEGRRKHAKGAWADARIYSTFVFLIPSYYAGNLPGIRYALPYEISQEKFVADFVDVSTDTKTLAGESLEYPSTPNPVISSNIRDYTAGNSHPVDGTSGQPYLYISRGR